MNTKLTLKICLLFLTGLAINRLPSDILADPPIAKAAAKSKDSDFRSFPRRDLETSEVSLSPRSVLGFIK